MLVANLDEAIAYLEERSEGLGLEPLADFEETLALACKDPDRVPVMTGIPTSAPYAVRRYLFTRFRYALVAAHVDNELVVIAVAHQRRRPGYWKSRLAKARP